MRIGRTLPPAASPIYIRDIINGFKGLIRGQTEIERFRSELKDHCGVKHCFLVSSGKAALTMILKALHDLHPERNEVIIPAFCCYSVPSAIVRAGLKVKLCDVNPDTLDFNYENLEKILSGKPENDSNQPINQSTNQPNVCTKVANNQPKTDTGQSEAVKNTHETDNLRLTTNTRRLLAIIPVHLFGLPVDVSKVRDMVTDSDVTVIEDAAQVIGSTWNGKKLGTLGHLGFFSLGRGKALSTVEGGIILTDQDDIADRINSQLSAILEYKASELVKLFFNAILLTFFQHPAFFWLPKCLPLLRVGDTIYDPEFKIRKMSTLQAGLASNWRVKLDTFQKQRQSASQQWKSDIEASTMHSYFTKNGYVPDLLRFPIRIDKRSVWENILNESDTNGLGIMFTYPDSIDSIPELKAALKGQSCPTAKKLPHQLVTLPIHPYVSKKDIRKIRKMFSKEISK